MTANSKSAFACNFSEPIEAKQRRIGLALGEHWTDSGLVFTNPDGTFLHPAYVSDVFCAIVAAAGLPPVRLHDLRHGAAMLMLAAGADLKVVQDLLGHSSITITGDTYAHVLPELVRDSAEAAAAIVPRQACPMRSAA
ncbi:tyrosine-type recombinase/integrase [Amycolatopsis sp. H20-H5]|uniref:tyrosine-type recombinase/integrase n=1 Tax=Amycolatopsis sp. H20-H5 TaxID=3046309 RepID=UPI002DBD1E85|nr:tyrosine-type recombinase/integrase [Amycolatopsis sp. H20-H5]MEC3982392.1 tyrosine-type recombinase/integrase [Amycolatopsis sp. H20-H5]